MLKPRSAMALFLLLVVMPTPAYAYLDAGTGSMILQLLLGGVGGALVVFKLYWFKIKRIFGGKPADLAHPEPE